mmetsp:Transcript_64498/g.154020  ORF Transcript_64498/g.154020 Transcript_64498/m.154020 type:complete len:310 (+) Transcript_64498:1130-2059(+)
MQLILTAGHSLRGPSFSGIGAMALVRSSAIVTCQFLQAHTESIGLWRVSLDCGPWRAVSRRRRLPMFPSLFPTHQAMLQQALRIPAMQPDSCRIGRRHRPCQTPASQIAVKHQEEAAVWLDTRAEASTLAFRTSAPARQRMAFLGVVLQMRRSTAQTMPAIPAESPREGHWLSHLQKTRTAQPAVAVRSLSHPAHNSRPHLRAVAPRLQPMKLTSASDPSKSLRKAPLPPKKGAPQSVEMRGGPVRALLPQPARQQILQSVVGTAPIPPQLDMRPGEAARPPSRRMLRRRKIRHCHHLHHRHWPKMCQL